MASIESYRAVRNQAGIIDRSERGKLRFSGSDRASYLQGLLTNDIAALTAGRGCYAAYLTPQGRMIADMHVLELGDMMLLNVHRDLAATLVKRFEQFIFAEDVQVSDVTAEWAQLGIHGPASGSLVAAALASGDGGREGLAEELAAFAEYQNTYAAFHGSQAIIARHDETGEQGFDVYVDPRQRSRFHEALRAAGALEVDRATAETLRIEAGRPAFKIDMAEDTIPLEAGITERAISLTKGCYVGQEVIIRILHRGHGRVARRLVGLTIQADGMDAEAVPPPGARVLQDGRAIGSVTSATLSPAVGKPIALAYLQRDFSDAGTIVHLTHGGRSDEAIVTALPFVRGR